MLLRWFSQNQNDGLIILEIWSPAISVSTARVNSYFSFSVSMIFYIPYILLHTYRHLSHNTGQLMFWVYLYVTLLILAFADPATTQKHSAVFISVFKCNLNMLNTFLLI